MWQAGYFRFGFMTWMLLILRNVNQLLGGVLRGVEFIYKESGVNRPLSPEDDEEKNLNNTIYEIQIIKLLMQ